MSWQTYVDEHLMCEIDGNHLSAAAIVGHDGSIWARSSNFPQFKQEEIDAIMNDFAELGSLAPTGLYLGGTKYMVIQGEPGEEAVVLCLRSPRSFGSVFLQAETPQGKKGGRRYCITLQPLSRRVVSNFRCHGCRKAW